MRELLKDLVVPVCLLIVIVISFVLLSWKNESQDRAIWRLKQEVNAFVIPRDP